MSPIPQKFAESKLDYYLNETGNSTVGPLKASELWKKLEDGQITGKTFAFTKGLTEWKRLEDSYWEEHGLALHSSDAPISVPRKVNEDSKFRWKIKQKDDDHTEALIDSDISESLRSKDLYLLKIEMGWWEKLLEEIQKQDLVEELNDITYLSEQKQRIVGLSENLREKGLLVGTAGDFISTEYHDFDKSAEKVEEEIQKVSLKMESTDFLTDYLNSSETISKEEIFLPITNEIQSLCKKFIQDNDHRILGKDNLDIWNLFGGKYGESEDLPLLYDLVKIGNLKPSSSDILKDLQSPVLQKSSKIMKMLHDLYDESGRLREQNYETLKELFDLTSSPFIKEMVDEKEKLFPETQIKINFEHAINDIEGDLPAPDQNSRIKSYLSTTNSEKERLRLLKQNLQTEDEVLRKILESKINDSIKSCENHCLLLTSKSDEIYGKLRNFKKSQAEFTTKTWALYFIIGGIVIVMLLSAAS